MNFSMGTKSYSWRTILDIVQSRSSSLSGISRMHIIRDMFGPGHSPLVSGAFFAHVISGLSPAQSSLRHRTLWMYQRARSVA